MVTLDGICLMLLFHPGWAVRHPLVEEGIIWELLHSSQSGELASLPVLPYNAVSWRSRDAELLDGVHLDGTLPPFRVTNDAPLPAEFASLWVVRRDEVPNVGTVVLRFAGPEGSHSMVVARCRRAAISASIS